MKEKISKKKMEQFVDSSEEDSIVLEDPYPKLPFADPQEFSPLTPKRLKDIRSNELIFNETPRSHHQLLRNKAVSASKNKKSPFPAPLAAVNKINALPSNPKKQKYHEETIVPTFRGIKCNNDLSASELFCFTRANWIDTHHFASMTFKIANIDIGNHIKAFLANDDDFLEQYNHYNLSPLNKHSEIFEENNKELKKAAKKLKVFFQCADKLYKPFYELKSLFPEMRNITDKKIAKQNFSLSEIISYIYVNSYDAFKEFMHDFNSILKQLNNSELKKSFKALNIPSKEMGNAMYHLSEGQTPRHPLLYGFALKNYTKGKKQTPTPLYADDLEPTIIYLGKVMVSCNPNTLFASKDKALYIPSFDSEHGNKIIGKTILPEKEIQHQAANLQGKIKHSVNLKLPKFHHKKAPKRYLAKYGLNNEYYIDFKNTFAFLVKHNEHGKLSWMYLETVLLAHLIQFHELQLFQYCNQLAYETQKSIFWVNRDLQTIEDPYPLDFSDAYSCSSE